MSWIGKSWILLEVLNSCCFMQQADIWACGLYWSIREATFLTSLPVFFPLNLQNLRIARTVVPQWFRQSVLLAQATVVMYMAYIYTRADMSGIGCVL